MHFKVVFSCWVDWSEPIFDDASKEEIKRAKEKREVFLVEAENEEFASAYAKRFEKLETNSCEGLDSLLEISEATLEESKTLRRLATYERYIPATMRLNFN